MEYNKFGLKTDELAEPNQRTLSLWSILGGRQSKKLTTSLVDFACVLELLSLFEGILTSVVVVVVVDLRF